MVSLHPYTHLTPHHTPHPHPTPPVLVVRRGPHAPDDEALGDGVPCKGRPVVDGVLEADLLFVVIMIDTIDGRKGWEWMVWGGGGGILNIRYGEGGQWQMASWKPPFDVLVVVGVTTHIPMLSPHKEPRNTTHKTPHNKRQATTQQRHPPPPPQKKTKQKQENTHLHDSLVRMRHGSRQKTPSVVVVVVKSSVGQSVSQSLKLWKAGERRFLFGGGWKHLCRWSLSIRDSQSVKTWQQPALCFWWIH
jgi:hypothetical protein